jgi:hypothetical protein
MKTIENKSGATTSKSLMDLVHDRAILAKPTDTANRINDQISTFEQLREYLSEDAILNCFKFWLVRTCTANTSSFSKVGINVGDERLAPEVEKIILATQAGFATVKKWETALNPVALVETKKGKDKTICPYSRSVLIGFGRDNTKNPEALTALTFYESLSEDRYATELSTQIENRKGLLFAIFIKKSEEDLEKAQVIEAKQAQELEAQKAALGIDFSTLTL